MKRRAILLGNLDGNLSTNLDLSKMYEFLLSLRGGAWSHSEIILKANISYHDLDILVRDTQNARFDYVIFYFSGHGGYERGTILELNPHGDIFFEKDVCHLASRQLNIYDCCRTLAKTQFSKLANSSALDNLSESFYSIKAHYRQIYESRIMQAYPQQMSLYSCCMNECSYDFGVGGIYTNSLINAVLSSKDTYILASTAHHAAYQTTIEEVSRHGVE